MITTEERDRIFQLLRTGIPVAEIAKKVGRSIGTIYNYKKIFDGVDNKDALSKQKNPGSTPRKLVAFEEAIALRLKVGITNVQKIFSQLREEGYKGSYASLLIYIRSLNSESPNYKRCSLVETPPGEQAQVDWGYFGKINIEGRIERLYAFVYVLSFSRAIYAELVVRQNLQTLQLCHMHAFEKLGVPKKIVYDNIKTVILSRRKSKDGKENLYPNTAFLDFAQYYGFQPEVCPPYWPRSKGKVEASVKYLRNNFAPGIISKKNLMSLAELNTKLSSWIENEALVRIHRSVNEKPLDRWLREKPFLRFPTEIPPFETAPLVDRRCTKDGMVLYKKNFYSVPTKYSCKGVGVKDISEHGVSIVEIYHQGELIASHPKSSDKGEWIQNDQHLLQEGLDAPEESYSSGRSTLKRRALRLAAPYRNLAYYDQVIPRRENGSEKS